MSLEDTDIFSSGISTLFLEPEINQGDHGETAIVKFPNLNGPEIKLDIANVDASNTKLFAHHVWKAAILMGKHLTEEMGEDDLKGNRVLELGAAAGIPSIICARFGSVVTASDYPDENLIATLKKNLKVNGYTGDYMPRVIGHIWGQKDELISSEMSMEEQYDLILLSDTLWMPHQHENLLDDLKRLLAPKGKILGVAGLHTGYKTFDKFFQIASSVKYGFQWSRKVYRIPLGNGFCEDLDWEEDDEENVIDEPGKRARWLYKYEMNHGMNALEQ